MEKDFIRLHDVSMSFEGEDVLKKVNLSIRDKEFLTLLGPSGCGKTTTLRIIGGFQSPSQGSVFFGGQDITKLPAHKRNVNTVFQRYALFPHLNVFENVAFGLRIAKKPENEIKKAVSEVLEIVNLSGFGKRSVTSMSGGEQQRVAIARAIVNRPRVLLLDEPLGALDLKLRKEMQIELKQIQKQLGITFIYVTHDQEEALTMSDTIVVMRDGIIEQVGSPEEIYNEPANAFVADFIGEANILNGYMTKDYEVMFEGKVHVCLDHGFGQNEPVDIIVRPEDVEIHPIDEGTFNGVVESIVFKGVHYEIVVDVDGYKWYVHTTDFHPVGNRVSILLTPEDIHIMRKMFKATENRFTGVVVDEETISCLGTEFTVENHGYEKGTNLSIVLPPVALDIVSEDIGQFTAYLESMIYKGRYNEFIVLSDLSETELIFHSQHDGQPGTTIGVSVDFSKAILSPLAKEAHSEE